MITVEWELIDCELFQMWRTPMPGGWLVIVRDSDSSEWMTETIVDSIALGTTFIPDPHELWVK